MFSRPNAKQLLEPLDLFIFKVNPPLAATACLEIVDRHRLAANHKLAAVGLIQPVVKRTYRDTQAARGLLGRHQIGFAALSRVPRHVLILGDRLLSGRGSVDSGRHAPDHTKTHFANRSRDAKRDAKVSQPGGQRLAQREFALDQSARIAVDT